MKMIEIEIVSAKVDLNTVTDVCWRRQAIGAELMCVTRSRTTAVFRIKSATTLVRTGKPHRLVGLKLFSAGRLDSKFVFS